MKKYSRVLFSVLSEGIPRCLIIQPTHWGLIRFSYWCHTRFILWRLVFTELTIFNFDVQWLLSTLLVALNQTASQFFYMKCFSGVSDIFTDKSTPHIMFPSYLRQARFKVCFTFKTQLSFVEPILNWLQFVKRKYNNLKQIWWK